MRRVDELRRCEESLEGYLDTSGAESLRVAAIERDTIVLVVDSAVQCARLRFLAPRIVARTARVLGRPDLRRLEVRVRPAPAERPGPDGRDRTVPSPATREFLRHTAAAVDDRRLKETLMRMGTGRPAKPTGTGPPPASENPPGHIPLSPPQKRRRR